MTTMAARILIVEDNIELNSALCDFLTEEGYEVIPAVDGRRALRRAFPGARDLVVLDIGLPDIDGVEVMHRLNDRGLEPAVILESCLPAPRGHTADAFLPKPFDLDQLLSMVHRLTGEQTVGAA